MKYLGSNRFNTVHLRDRTRSSFSEW